MRRLKTVRRPPIYPKTPGHLPCSSLTHPLPLSSRRPSVSFGGFGLKKQIASEATDNAYGSATTYFLSIPDTETPTLDAKAEMVMSDVVNCYGKLSVKGITAVSKKTGPFKKASQHDMLTMEQLAPALTATAEDVEAYNRDLEENGTLTLEQIKRDYGLE